MQIPDTIKRVRLFISILYQEDDSMNQYPTEELNRLISESLRERPDSYTIQQLFEQFPTTTELIDASEQQLVHIKGIGKARQITAILKLARILTAPTKENSTIRSPKDAFDLFEPELRYASNND
jgi:DNA repair protein RadC